MRKFIFLVLVMFISFTINPAQAALIDMGIYSTDDATNLDWLELTQTQGQSWGYVETQFGTGGAYDGWRYATGLEFDMMVDGMGGIGPYEGWTTRNSGIVDPLLAHFGDLSGFEKSHGVLADEDVSGPVLYRHVATINDGPLIFPTPDDYDEIITHDLLFTSDLSDAMTGSYLVRASVVPEPSTMLLLGSGLLGMVLYRRKQGVKQV